jgi:hypothetical protein
MHAALAFLNGAGTQCPKSRRAEKRFLTLINALCGTIPVASRLPVASPRAPGRTPKSRP